MKTLPEHVSAFQKTAEFTETSVPKGLLKDHNTKAGVWGKIVVLEGKLEYTILEPEVVCLSPELPGVVEPMMLHYVKPLGQVKFYVEFYR